MEITRFRLYIVADEKLRNRIETFDQAFELLRKDYEVVEGLTLYRYLEWQSFENVGWEDYWGDGESFGLDRAWIALQNKRIRKQSGEEFASVVYLVDPSNWKAQGIGGWNLGRFFSGMSAQIAKGYNTVRSTHLVLSMEVAHALNEQVYRELGIRLKDVFGVKDWDYEIVHGEHPDYTAFQYQPVFKRIADLLLRTFQKREARFAQQLKTKLSLLTRLVDLYRQLIVLMRKVESPVLDDEVEEKQS